MGRSTVSTTGSFGSSSSLTPVSENTATMPPKKNEKRNVGPQKIIVLKMDPARLAKWAPSKDTVTANTSNANSVTGSLENSPRNSSPLAAGATPQVGSPIGSEALSVQTAGTPGKPGPKRGRQPGAPPGKPGRKKQKLYVLTPRNSSTSNHLLYKHQWKWSGGTSCCCRYE